MKREFERTLAKESKSNPKAFYKYANEKLKTKSGIGNLETKDGKVITDKGKAEALNKFFTSVFTREDTDHIPECKQEEIRVPLEDLIITKEDVKIKTRQVQPHKVARTRCIAPQSP